MYAIPLNSSVDRNKEPAGRPTQKKPILEIKRGTIALYDSKSKTRQAHGKIMFLRKIATTKATLSLFQDFIRLRSSDQPGWLERYLSAVLADLHSQQVQRHCS